MFPKDEFKKYATKHQGISSLNLERFDKAQQEGFKNSLTPYVIEERQMNATQLDVFSRLMMDRILFLGTDVNFQVAIIFKVHYFFLE